MYIMKKFRKSFMSHFVNKLNGEFIVFDLETTGLDAKSDRIIQIAAIKATYKDGRFTETTERFNLYINPERDVSPKIEKLTGIKNDFLGTQKTEDEVFNEIFDFFGDMPVCCGYNILNFDIGFMQELYRRHGKIFISPNALDVLLMSRDIVDTKSTKSYKLQDVATYYDVVDGLHFHNALDDVIATYRLFIRLFREYENMPRINGTILPRIYQKYAWQGKRHDLARIYFCTDMGKIYFDIYKYEWGSKEIDLSTIDLDRFIDNAYRFCSPSKTILNDDEFYYVAKSLVKMSSSK